MTDGLETSENRFKPALSIRLRALLELMRPANIITAFADILAGAAVAGGSLLFWGGGFSIIPGGLGWLLLATFGLYGGGVVMNDFFDAELDALERPERPIPDGRISRPAAGWFGSLLLLLGIICGFIVNITAGFIALGIALCASIYDAKAKHSVFLGPLFMGSCRGGNLLLGCSIIPSALPEVWFLALLPLVYIASITLVSQGEVHGGNKIYGFTALGLIALIISAFFLLSFLPLSYSLLTASPFLILFTLVVIPPFFKAARQPDPANIKPAIKKGVISIVLLNSVFAAGFGGFISGIIVLILFFTSIIIAKSFHVT